MRRIPDVINTSIPKNEISKYRKNPKNNSNNKKEYALQMHIYIYIYIRKNSKLKSITKKKDKDKQKTRNKSLAPLLKLTRVISEVDTPKDKSKAMRSPLAGKKSNKNDKQPYRNEVIGGVVTPQDKAAKATPPWQNNLFKKQFVRLPYKTKQKMYCF